MLVGVYTAKLRAEANPIRAEGLCCSGSSGPAINFILGFLQLILDFIFLYGNDACFLHHQDMSFSVKHGGSVCVNGGDVRGFDGQPQLRYGLLVLLIVFHTFFVPFGRMLFLKML